jgi:hypothetical protein
METQDFKKVNRTISILAILVMTKKLRKHKTKREFSVKREIILRSFYGQNDQAETSVLNFLFYGP